MRLFTNATTKLAVWYLFILMSVSLIFSVIIFQIIRSELSERFTNTLEQSQLVNPTDLITPLLAHDQLETVTINLLVSLGYINLVILLIGGAGAYFLARQTLKPIEATHDAQSRFVANASHQFRTPLAIMKAETELALSDTSAKKANLRKVLESNLEEINHLTDLSAMMLDLSRSEETLKQTTDTIDLPEIIRDVVKSRHIASRTELDLPDSLTVYSHETAIREICHILIDNSIKHSPPSTPIRITLEAQKQSVLLTIHNDGPVIPKEHLPHVFERFYRASQTKGYGLGLPLARQLARALGGDVILTSGEKRGVTMHVQLPQA